MFFNKGMAAAGVNGCAAVFGADRIAPNFSSGLYNFQNIFIAFLESIALL